jgi:hypothetical protein
MSEDAPSTLHVILADEVTSGQVAVPLEAFAEFCVRMEMELDGLVSRFASFAAPGALSMRRSSTLP